ncbi:MAG: gamma-glutamyltransferase [Cyclonatronaceae bacterium]
MRKNKGVIAAGNEQTVQVAEEILRSGGNAFDAAIAAHLAACITEPVLSSPGGGGFMLARTPEGTQTLYDFFVHTPRHRRNPDEVEFYPISADFGEALQEFHIGMGSAAVPGTVRGLFAIHRDLCRMPMKQLAAPAIEFARNGVALNHFQAYILDIVKPVFMATEGSMRIYGRPEQEGGLLKEGQLLHQPDMADFLDVLATEGEDFFYRGEFAGVVDRLCREQGGHLTREDFESYEVIRRKPLMMTYRDAARIALNPAPSSGGMLIAFALKLMEDSDPAGEPFGSARHLLRLASVQQQTELARVDYLMHNNEPVPGEGMLKSSYVEKFRREVVGNPRFNRGTTHISIMDADGNTASLTTSNGEGCGRIIPETGIMLNNMLGEEDLHPAGFHNWPTDKRITSMMTPGVVTMKNGSVMALGSGGSNRIRTAILQVILNLTDYGMSPEEAVSSPRLHCEKDFLSIEHGFDRSALEPVLKAWPDHRIWGASNLFFGGVHSVMDGPDGFHGVGDARRGGVARVVR